MSCPVRTERRLFFELNNASLWTSFPRKGRCHPPMRSANQNHGVLFWSAASLLLAAILSQGACVSPKYERASKHTPPIQPLNAQFPTSPLDGTLYAEISDGAPGSWKREAFWDEYVVVLHNKGHTALTIVSATLADYAGAARPAGSDPWALERESKSLERRYRDAGISFSRMAAPRVIASAAEPTVAATAGISAATAAALTAVTLPVVGATVFGINMHNKSVIRKEFDRRRIQLPLILGAGETRAGSFFFPMVPNPQSLTVRWTGGDGDGETRLELQFLQGLHVSGGGS